jgi:hypothetical protein
MTLEFQKPECPELIFGTVSSVFLFGGRFFKSLDAADIRLPPAVYLIEAASSRIIRIPVPS